MKRLCYLLSTFFTFAPLPAVLAKVPETAKVVFTSSREGNSEIYIMNPDGSDQINLTQHRDQDGAPVWSPTGHCTGMNSFFLVGAISESRLP